MQKSFRFEQGGFPVRFGEGVIRLDNNEQLWIYIRENPPVHTQSLVEWTQKKYNELLGYPLDISDRSLILEIWGHMYFEYWMLRNKWLGRILLPFGLYERLVVSCEVIDCGVSGIDNNRWLWDILGVTEPVVSRFLKR